MNAIVMAAGEGTRLRPITEQWPKPVLPIDGRPVIATLVRALGEEGLGPVTVVTGYLAEQVEALLDGLDVQFARQPVADGSADAVRHALAGGATLPAVVSAADSVFCARRSRPLRRAVHGLGRGRRNRLLPRERAGDDPTWRTVESSAWSTRSPESCRPRRSGA